LTSCFIGSKIITQKNYKKGEIHMHKRLLFTIFLCFLVLSSFSSLNAQWARTYGGEWDEGGVAIQQTSDGGYIVAGYTTSFGAGLADIWILKLTSSGDIDWQLTYGGSAWADVARFIQQTSDGGYIVAGRTYSFGAGGSDIWVLKLSSTGTIEWQKTYGGNDDDEAYSIQQTSDGGYIVAGETWSFIAGYEGVIWVLKLSSTGTIEWQKIYEGGYGDEAYSIQQTSDGGYIVTGRTWSFGAGGCDIWILKLSSTGTIEWQRTYGGSNWDVARSIQQTSDGGYIVAGCTESFGAGGSDIWILKLSSSGTINWQKTYGGSEDDEAYSIKQRSDGGFIVAGRTGSFGAGSDDAWILKLSSTGTIDWQRTYGSDWGDDARSIQQTNDGGYIVTGETGIIGAFWLDDVWVLKLFSNGDIDQHCGFIGTSNASVLNTSVSSGDTNITPEDTFAIPSDTSISPQPSDANVMDICQEFILTISATTGGTTNPAPGNHTYSFWAQVSVQAIPSSGYQFSSWSGDVSGTRSQITIRMDSDKSITANFTATTPPPTPGDGGDGGGCFITTAAYGSPFHPHVETLRDFRDKYLLPNKLGRKFVDFYYKYSPFVANLIAKQKSLRVIVQINLTPFVVFSYSMVHLGPLVTGGILILVLVFPIFSFFHRA
jgi:uncharacterized delta-60 repeat protein